MGCGAWGHHAELAPVCAIVGSAAAPRTRERHARASAGVRRARSRRGRGIVAAEVVKIISAKEAPINNVFLFDATVTDDNAAGVAVRFG